MPKEIKLKKHRTFGDVFTDSFQFSMKNWKPLFTSIVYFAGPALLLSTIFTTLYLGKMMNFYSKLGEGIREPDAMDEEWLRQIDEDPFFMLSQFMGPEYWLLILCSMIVGAMFIIIICKYMSLYAASEDGEVLPSEVWVGIKEHFFPVLGATLLTSFVTVIGMLCCIIPGIYWMVGIAPLYMIMIEEKLSIGGAIKRSFYLVKDNWWQTFGVIVLIYMVINMVSSVFQTPAMLIAMISSMFADLGSIGTTLMSFFASLAMIVSYMFYAIYFVAIGMWYYSLVELKESPGMDAAIDQIGEPDLDAGF